MSNVPVGLSYLPYSGATPDSTSLMPVQVVDSNGIVGQWQLAPLSALAPLSGNGIFNVLDPQYTHGQAIGNGTIDARFAFVAAQTACGTAGTLLVPPGTYRIASNLTLTSAITFLPGAVLKPDNGVTVTIGGPFSAAIVACFDITAGGTVRFATTVAQVCPQWWGARGDGENDDTAAIQAAINAAQVTNYATVFFPTTPVAVYKTTASLVISGPIRLTGAHEGLSIRGTGMTAGTFVLDINGGVSNLENVVIENLCLFSDNGAPDGIRLREASVCTIRDVRLFTLRHGITITGERGHDLFFERVEVYGLSGNAFYTTAFTGGGQHSFLGCSATSCNFGYVVDWPSVVTGATWFGGLFEANASVAVFVNGTVDGLAFFGTRFEKNGSRDLDMRPLPGNNVFGLVVHGCFFDSNNVDDAILLGGSSGTVRGFSICGNYAEVYATAFIVLNGDGQSGLVVGNRVHLCPAITNVVRAGVLVVNNEGDSGSLGAVWNPPLVTPTLPADATDLASAITLVNAMKGMATSIGLGL